MPPALQMRNPSLVSTEVQQYNINIATYFYLQVMIHILGVMATPLI